ncbi:MAG: hypothetical protein DRJ51_06055 [Thermoprotei archaeon]|nr:MAG: hypothetical protein DRJ51_06055 [Thermoprotei archaeon]RLF01588.1 MAG: hypothetical protein DRJ59_05750 [Thermoprotei archaeon]
MIPEVKKYWLPVLLLLYLRGRLGRRQISHYLGIGEGRVKRIIRELSGKGLLDTKRGGEALSKDGLIFLFKSLVKHNIFSVHGFDASEVCEKCESVGFLLKNLIPCRIVDVRDEAVRGGARGALIIQAVDDSLVLPPDLGNLGDYYPKLEEAIKRCFKISKGDVIILAYSRNFGEALLGGLRASLLANKIFTCRRT